jgi:aspartate aminotransferase
MEKNMILNETISNLQPSKSMLFMAKAKQLQAIDNEILDLSGGEPDFDTPVRVREEAKRWLDAGYTHYAVGAGLPELRQRIAKKLREENDCSYTAEDVIVTPGAKFAIYLAVRALINPKDEVLYLEPGWVSYPSIIEASGGIPVPIQLQREHGYALKRESLESLVTERTKALIINYPCNPTGMILSAPEANIIHEFMLTHPHIALVSDEIYERIVFDGLRSTSMASYTDIAGRVVTINGFSKSMAMTGWRIGYLATSSPQVRKVIDRLFQHTITCVSGFIMKASVVALDCQEDIERMRLQYERRRDIFVNGLNAIPRVDCLTPKGAFYAWVKFDVPHMNAEQFSDFLLKHAKVVGVPGDAYGSEDCHIRFSLASSAADLETAVTRIEKAMKILMEQESQ